MRYRCWNSTDYHVQREGNSMKSFALFLLVLAQSAGAVTLTITPSSVNLGTVTNTTQHIGVTLTNTSTTTASTVNSVNIINQSTPGAFFWNNSNQVTTFYCQGTNILAINNGGGTNPNSSCTINITMNLGI